MRNLNDEHSPNQWRDYQYDFDITARKALLKRWERHFDGGGRALEMGSYDGSMTSLIKPFFSQLEVIEGSENLAKQVEDRFQGQVIVHQGWFENFSPKVVYDNIFLVHGLEHVENPVRVLEDASQWLSPTGKIFIAVPNANALSRQIAVKMGVVSSLQAVTDGEKLHGHLRTYNLDTLVHDCRSAGLAIQEMGGVILKALSNSQFDASVAQGIVGEAYIHACDELSRIWPDFSASIYVVASRG